MTQLPGSYSEMWPGRFLKADLLKGSKVTMTIKNIMGEELTGDDDKTALKWIVQFVERDKELVLAKVNGECFRRIFGNDPRACIGKKVTLFPSTTKAFGKTVDCIRIWGSPHLEEDMQITVRDGDGKGRAKTKNITLHKVNAGECGFKGDAKSAVPSPANQAANSVDPRIIAAWGILGLSDGIADMQVVGGSPAEYLADLNRRIDLMA